MSFKPPRNIAASRYEKRKTLAVVKHYGRKEFQGATRWGATGLRASEREICLWEGLWEDLWKPLKISENLWKMSEFDSENLWRFFNNKCFLEGFLEGACKGFQLRQGS